MPLAGKSPHGGIEHLPFNSYVHSNQFCHQPFDCLLLHNRLNSSVSAGSPTMANPCI